MNMATSACYYPMDGNDFLSRISQLIPCYSSVTMSEVSDLIPGSMERDGLNGLNSSVWEGECSVILFSLPRVHCGQTVCLCHRE